MNIFFILSLIKRKEVIYNLAAHTKLDIYDCRVKFEGGKIVFLELDDLSDGDIISITGQLVATDNLIYYDNHRGEAIDYVTKNSVTFVGRRAMDIMVKDYN